LVFTRSERMLPSFYKEYGPSTDQILRRGASFLSSNPIKALHYHSCTELGICLRGEGITYVENRKYRFKKGDLQVVPKGISHLSMSEKGVLTEWLWITLRPSEILERALQETDFLEQQKNAGYSGVFHPWEYPRLARIIYSFRDLAEDRWDFRLQCVFLCGQLVLECASIGEADQVKGIGSASAGKMIPALEYIRKNYADQEAMREERIAETCHLSSSHFRSLFKKETGLTVREFILRTRLVSAAHLLKTTRQSILSVALESGFGQISCFNRAFLRCFGQTPSAFRRGEEQSEDFSEDERNLSEKTREKIDFETDSAIMTFERK